MPPTLVLRIDKSGLDDAHKDKNHKQYSSDFKVSIAPYLSHDSIETKVKQK